MVKRTYTATSTWRADEIGPAGHLTYTDTIYEDGRVEWSVRGSQEGEYVNESGVRQAECAIDWERLHSARTRSGWRLVGE